MEYDLFSLPYFTKIFFSLPAIAQDIIRRLYWEEQQVRKRKRVGVFPSINRLRRNIRRNGQKKPCCRKTVQRFNNVVKSCGLFEVVRRKRPNGSDTSNQYFMDERFFDALKWLDLRNLLRAKKHRFQKIVDEAERAYEASKIKSSSLTKQKCPTPLLPLKKNKDKYYYISPTVGKITGLEPSQQRVLSRFAEAAIMQGIFDVMWYRNQGKIIHSLFAILYKTIQRHAVRLQNFG
jgi:hypothetical protein